MPKKILSLLLTLVLAFSLCLPASAAAAPEASPREAAAAAYGALFDKNELEANTKNAKIIWLLSFDASYKALGETFLLATKDDASAEAKGYGLGVASNLGQDASAYAAALDALTKKDVAALNPYTLANLTIIAGKSGLAKDFRKKTAEALRTYYDADAGQFLLWGGLDYSSADDQALCLVALCAIGDPKNVAERFPGAIAALQMARSDSGYLNFGSANASTTALAAAAYAALGKETEANEAFTLLSSFRHEDGAYLAHLGDSQSDLAFATADALLALTLSDSSLTAPADPAPANTAGGQPAYLWPLITILCVVVVAVLLAVILIRRNKRES